MLAAILMVQEALKRFGPEGGSVINLSSTVGSHPVAGASALRILASDESACITGEIIRAAGGLVVAK